MLPRLCDVFVRFEERSDVHCLTAPEISIHCPVEGELEGVAVEASEEEVSGRTCRQWLAFAYKTCCFEAIVGELPGLAPRSRIALSLSSLEKTPHTAF